MKAIGKAFFVFLIGLLLNLIGYWVLTYFWPVEWSSGNGMLRIILCWIVLPLVFGFMAYKFMMTWFARQVFIQLSPHLRPTLEGSLRYLMERNGGKAESRHQINELEEKVRSMADRIPSFFLGFIIGRIRQIPLMRFIPKTPSDASDEKELEAKLESSYFELNAYMLDKFFDASMGFLYWLVPVNLVVFVVLIIFRP